MKFLYKFYWDCGRSGDLKGLFVATEEEVAKAIGSEAYFGEVLGKHSEVYGTIDDGDIQKLDISSEAIEEVSQHLGETWSGFNPLYYLKTTCDQCEESYRADEWDVDYREEFEMEMCDECYEERKNENE
ncbi:hypothetical protein [Bacillus sp. FJAT-22090]|uniref:hypothetical protein n=1 Tax=Bacillus sp. FJAT-22090 TaxID=1581038 RepID=UPI0011A116FB|nr:hypothetical protein [Bacillus sp. FJAT-22090]